MTSAGPSTAGVAGRCEALSAEGLRRGTSAGVAAALQGGGMSDAWRFAQAQVSITRFESALARHPQRLLMRCFTAQEQAFSEGRRSAAQHLAVRFAAKRATRALLGVGALVQVEVVRADSGAPSLRLHGAAAHAAGGRTVHVSLSHDADTAVALVALGPASGDLPVPSATAQRVAR